MSDSEGSTTYSGINTKNILITDAAKQTLLTGLSAEAMADRVFTATTTENAEALSGALENRFDAVALQKELDTQREVSQAFSQNVQSAKAELNQAADRLTADYEAGRISQAEYDAKRQQLDNGALLLSTIAAGLSAPTDSALGIATATLSPSVAKEIGQYFKSTNKEGSTEHLIAHGLLAAAVAATGGNNALTAAGAAISAESAAPVLAHYLYGKAAADLNADEKATLSSITSLVGAGVGATTGADSNLAQGAQSAGTAVDNNFLTAIKQYPEFGQEMEAACAISAEACQETRQKWYDLSVKQSGLTEEGVVAWHEKLDATFKNLYAQCQGDTSCVAYLDLQKESASITHLGLHEELGVLGINLKHTLDIKQGNWGTLALDALADFSFVPAPSLVSQGAKLILVNKLTQSSVKFNKQALVAIRELPNGKVVFLETGQVGVAGIKDAGLAHIVKEHAGDFAKVGIKEKDIPKAVMDAVNHGKFLGYQGKGTGRAIYQVTVNGKTQNIAVTVGSNGYIVGANPTSVGR
ncbi:VENN motif pre-toxin domain-containing protein [Oligella ureolytica]|uniref:VENN motif pre-toxin domain-containing protein n=1 Tax=Oligella ureolytica TaxID=90244 RepID=UPI002100243D|nr:VENN motif pre-toxin domain-containing protein [Oligella ureolytica]